MIWFQQPWVKKMGITVAGAVLTAFFLQNFVTDDSWVPASRGWYRVQADGRAAARDKMIQEIQDKTQEKFDSINKRLDSLDSGQLQTRIDSYEVKILILQQELSSLRLRQRTSPDDPIISGRITVLESLINRAENERQRIYCDLQGRC